jgi:CubicO group peptidase (beta-lactamase class C family)
MRPADFPRLRQEFERQISLYPPGTGAAIAIYRDQDLVVDLWSGESAPGVRWHGDTMAVTFSASKGVSAATLVILAERIGVDFDQPLARYWSAFGAASKEALTVAEVLSHRAGLPYWEDYRGVVTAESPVSTWLREDDIAASLAAAATIPGTRGRFVYHSLTLGWLIHGLVRAITGVSLSEYFDSSLASPYGLDFYLGVSPEQSRRVATLIADPPLTPDPDDPDVEHTAKALLPSSNGLDYLHNLDLINSDAFHTVPQGACNGIGTARGLAGVYAALAHLSPENALMTRFMEPLVAIVGPGPRLHQGLGFQVGMPTPWNEADTAFGHTGAGGGIGFYDPKTKLAFALITNHMNFGEDERLDRLRAAMAGDLAATRHFAAESVSASQ